MLTLMLALPAFFQNTNVIVQPDLRLFTTMAGLNAAGFDVEFASEYHPVRQTVRKYAAEVDADLRLRLKTSTAVIKGRRLMKRSSRSTFRWQSVSAMHPLSNR